MEFTDCIFSPHLAECKEPFGAAPCGSPVRFRIRPGRGFTVSAARMILTPDQGEAAAIEMSFLCTEQLCDIFEAAVTPENTGLYFYHFEVDTPFGRRYICPSSGGAGELLPVPGGDWQLTVFQPGFETSAWLKGAILYQIFPDRFNRSGELPEVLPQGRVLHPRWGETPAFGPDESGVVRNNDYFGGNLRGIVEKLPYLQSMGVTALYLNPIFEAHSNHRYNTADYLRIDPLLGDEEDFRTLCKEAAKRGIGIILDGVFNHTGDDSVYFNRYGRYPGLGAYQSTDSPYYGWYRFKEWPDEYDCWWGFKTLPGVNEDCVSFSDFITGQGGVLEHWLRAGAKGFRLDVADELPDSFIEKIRRTVKNTDPEALLVGEVWEDASNKVSYGSRKQYLEGSELDSVMNYPFRESIIGFILSGAAAHLNETVLSVLDHYPAGSVDVLMNLLGTHDTLRILTALAGDSPEGMTLEEKATRSLTPGQREKGIRLVMLAAALQYFLPGVPCVYYGDEAGVEGYQDPFNRRCYPWGEEDKTLQRWYKQLGRLRGACPALVSGAYRCVAAEPGFYVFTRSERAEQLCCAVNSSDSEQSLTLPAGMRHPVLLVATPGARGDSLVMEPHSCMIFGSGSWVKGL